MNKVEKFSYLVQNEYGEVAGIFIFIKKKGSIFVIIQRGSKNKRIQLSVNVTEKYELIKRVVCLMIDKREQSLDCILNKKMNNHSGYNYYPVSLSYLNEQYILSIQLPDSTFKSVIHNIEELLSYLKEGIVFPGDKFVGLEVIEILDCRKGHRYWKAKCLLCGRTTEVTIPNLRNYKSCGCLNSRRFNSDDERFFSYIDKQENIPEDQQIKGTLTDLSLGPCWLWTGYKNEKGYGLFSINNKSLTSSRYSLQLELERNLLPGECSLHICDNPSCVNPDHLFVGTHLDNAKDRDNKGRGIWLRGEENYNTKLKDVVVVEIKGRLSAGEKQVYLAKEYGVSQSTISTINLGKRENYLR